jgi:ABC-2 type transport system ATP-binding protein
MDALAPSEAPAAAPATAREAVVRTVGLTKRYGKRLAVNGLNLEVQRGDVFGLLGPNGSGKTTTLRMLLGLVWPTEGEIHMFGGDLAEADQRRTALRRVGAVVEQPAFYPYLSGRENLRGVAIFAGLADSAETRARIQEALEHVGLSDRAKDAYRKYSLGMKQRLGIAAALLMEPELVILDEPTNGLDPAGVVEVRGLIGTLAQRGITILLSSHLLYEVQQVCTRVAVLKEGVLLGQGTVAELLAAQGGIQLGFTDSEQLPQAVSILQQAADGGNPWLRGARYVQPEPGAWVPPGGWYLLVDAPAERAAEVNALLAARGTYAAEVRRREGSLETYFLTLTGGTQEPQASAPASGPPAPAQQGGAA